MWSGTLRKRRVAAQPASVLYVYDNYLCSGQLPVWRMSSTGKEEEKLGCRYLRPACSGQRTVTTTSPLAGRRGGDGRRDWAEAVGFGEHAAYEEGPVMSLCSRFVLTWIHCG